MTMIYLTQEQAQAIHEIARSEGNVAVADFDAAAEPIKEVRVFKEDEERWLYDSFVVHPDSFVVHPDGTVEGPTEVDAS